MGAEATWGLRLHGGWGYMGTEATWELRLHGSWGYMGAEGYMGFKGVGCGVHVITEWHGRGSRCACRRSCGVPSCPAFSHGCMPPWGALQP